MPDGVAVDQARNRSRIIAIHVGKLMPQTLQEEAAVDKDSNSMPVHEGAQRNEKPLGSAPHS
jgi:hypothetical protein